MCTTAELDALKEQWRENPCWELADTEGYEAYRAELQAFQNEVEASWESEYANRKQPTSLDKAYSKMAEAESKLGRAAEGSTISRQQAESAMTWAVAYGQLAQAEALTRIAAALEMSNLATWNIKAG
jgi:hypothetical protein